jgi:hypothetical protein
VPPEVVHEPMDLHPRPSARGALIRSLVRQSLCQCPFHHGSTPTRRLSTSRR